VKKHFNSCFSSKNVELAGNDLVNHVDKYTRIQDKCVYLVALMLRSMQGCKSVDSRRNLVKQSVSDKSLAVRRQPCELLAGRSRFPQYERGDRFDVFSQSALDIILYRYCGVFCCAYILAGESF